MIQNIVNDQLLEDEIQIISKGFSLAQYSQTHPYQYLKQLNKVYQKCNKSGGNDYSSASMVKLPWKSFKPVAIPKCFEQNYNLEKKQTCVSKGSEQNNKSEQYQKERKFWKEHEDLMIRYHQNKLNNNKIKIEKMEKRRKLFLQSKIYTNNPQTILQTKRNYNSVNNKSLYKSNTVSSLENKQNEERFSTTKTELDANDSKDNQNKYPFLLQKKTYLLDNLLIKDKSNMFLKKIIQKGSNLNYDQNQLQEEVISKLKKISTMSNYNRAKTSNIYLSNKSKQKHLRRQAINKAPANVCSFKESRIKESEYLQFNREQELISRYKQKIRSIDYSICEKNVKKTAEILREMQNIADTDYEQLME